MAELILDFLRDFRRYWPRSAIILLPVVLLVILIVLLIIFIPPLLQPASAPPAEPAASSLSPSPAPSPAASLLVTADQISRLSYTDSTLGELSWELSRESLLELNQTLVRYGIVSSEEICHFLAQATIETGAGHQLTEQGSDEYFKNHGITAGTRGAGYLHLTHDYGQMAFATWMMRRYVPSLSGIAFVNPSNHGREEVAAAYYAALQTAANLGLNVSLYSRIVYDPNSTCVTGADYIAEAFAWESAAYYWTIAGIGDALAEDTGSTLDERIDLVSDLIGGANWQSRREAFTAFVPVLMGA